MGDIITNRKVESLGKDLALSLITAPFGFLMGNAGAFLNPLTIPEGIRDIRNNGINSVNRFVYTAMGAATYTNGVYRIAKYIMDDPSKSERYIPVITNILAFMGWGALKIYQKGKEKGKLEERIK